MPKASCVNCKYCDAYIRENQLGRRALIIDCSKDMFSAESGVKLDEECESFEQMETPRPELEVRRDARD